MTNKSGLEGVSVADTELSLVDGERGELVLRGHRVDDLAGRVPFEDAVGLFFDGRLPDAGRREELRVALERGRAEAYERLPRGPLELKDGMEALRGAVGGLDDAGPAGRFRLVGAVAVAAAAWARRAAGRGPLPPTPGLRHAEDFLAMVRGTAPPPEEAAAADAYLVTVIDHGMNASTFAARVVASTGSDDVSAVTAAIAALKGPLHGGAPGPVLDMLDAVGRADRARAWVGGELAAGRRIMGMGHRVYRVRDPRAAVLEKAITRLAASERLALARAVEREAEALLAARHPDRPLKANVEFYTAVLLEAIGLPRGVFTPTFATARVVGWLAHVDEQRRTGRLIRPAANYVGPMPQAAA
jgi:citrate synthase